MLESPVVTHHNVVLEDGYGPELEIIFFFIKFNSTVHAKNESKFIFSANEKFPIKVNPSSDFLDIIKSLVS